MSEDRTTRPNLDVDAVRAAYRRWSGLYDAAFGGVSAAARRRTVGAVNRLPGSAVLEVGVGTGLALPHYAPGKRVIGIDLSRPMLARAKARVAARRLGNVELLAEMDAEAMGFPDARFDVAVAMFVASVTPNPRRLLAEMRRVVRPGGDLLFINHFEAASGPRRRIERAMAPAARLLGWHPDFPVEALLEPAERLTAELSPTPPFGLFTLTRLRNDATTRRRASTVAS